MLTTAEAAAMLRVSSRTVLNWIESDAIPYVTLPRVGAGRREYRIPLHGLLESLSGNYDLGRELRALDRATRGLHLSDEDALRLTSEREAAV
jgi:excisionase family DNA binding protein